MLDVLAPVRRTGLSPGRQSRIFLSCSRTSAAIFLDRPISSSRTAAVTVLARSNSLSKTAIFFSAAPSEAATRLCVGEDFACGPGARRVRFRGVDFRGAFVGFLFLAMFTTF